MFKFNPLTAKLDLVLSNNEVKSIIDLTYLSGILDGRYVNITGDTMTGDLKLNDNINLNFGDDSDYSFDYDTSTSRLRIKNNTSTINSYFEFEGASTSVNEIVLNSTNGAISQFRLKTNKNEGDEWVMQNTGLAYAFASLQSSEFRVTGPSSILPMRVFNTAPNNSFYMTSSSLTINENGENYDFRVESDNQSSAIFVDASLDLVSFNNGDVKFYNNADVNSIVLDSSGLSISTSTTFNNDVLVYDANFEINIQSTLYFKTDTANYRMLFESECLFGNGGIGMWIDNQGDLYVKSYSDATRPTSGTQGRIIFNTTDGNLNIDDGTNWILPDGTTT